MKLNEKQIAYIIRERKKGTSSSIIASRMKVTPRRVYQIYERYVKTGSAPKQLKVGRPKREPTAKEIQMVVEAYDTDPQGAIRLAQQLRNSHMQISYDTVQKIMKAKGLASPAPAKRRRRDWIRFERKYSNAMWHVDWHLIDDPRWGKLYLICYLDDASRCITGFGVFEHATTENALLVLDEAIKTFGRPAQILSDHGTQFTSNKKPKKGQKKLTIFERALHKRKIIHILAGVGRPQTNGKIERFFGTFENEVGHYDRVDEYIRYYNERRLHFALDMKNGETPLKAFRAKRASAKIRRDPKWADQNSESVK